MQKIITERTANTTPNLHWDYVTFYEADNNGEPIANCAYGKTPDESLKNFLDNQEA